MSQLVIIDQGSLGGSAPKTTALHCTPDLLPYVDRCFAGVLLGESNGESTKGFDDQGKSKAAKLARYPPEFCARLATAQWLCVSAEPAVGGAGAPPAAAPLPSAGGG